jgi:hypothetical protein
MQRVVRARLALQVVFNEYSPQVPLVNIEALHVDVHQAEDGQIVAQAGYDYTG